LKHVEQGGTVILTTHILEVAERLAERIGIIQRGKLIAEGSLDELRQQTNNGAASLEEVFLQLTDGAA
jgi:ABC-2 type transport system ATP-binding protein